MGSGSNRHFDFRRIIKKAQCMKLILSFFSLNKRDEIIHQRFTKNFSDVEALKSIWRRCIVLSKDRVLDHFLIREHVSEIMSEVLMIVCIENQKRNFEPPHWPAFEKKHGQQCQKYRTILELPKGMPVLSSRYIRRIFGNRRFITAT